MPRFHDLEPASCKALLRHLGLLALAALGVSLLPLTATAQGKDELWEVTMKMDMPGMPMAMPAQTNRVCTAKGRKEEDYVPHDPECKMTESSRAGNKLSYKMACDGKNKMTIVGEMTYAADKYDGRHKMTGTMEGTPMEVTQTFSGKRVGDCAAK